MTAENSAVRFLTGEGHDHRGRRFEDVLAFDDSALELSHDYIQWLFPLPQASRFSVPAPVLDAVDIAAIGTSSAVQANLRCARDRMLAFYRATDHWLAAFDHNHLRITRCLALCLGEQEARRHDEILALVEAAGTRSMPNRCATGGRQFPGQECGLPVGIEKSGLDVYISFQNTHW